ncbi:MAG: ABC transporter permease [Bacteroidales bacterium]|nr:ABC transporter permease [Bacteroidales bacterium]
MGNGQLVGIFIIGILIAVIIAICGGLVNGFLVTGLDIPPVMATIAMQLVWQGLSIALTRGDAVTGLPLLYTEIGHSKILGFIPFPLLIFIIGLLIAAFLVKKTTYGEKLYMIGTNQKACVFSAINVKFTIIITYCLCSVYSVIGCMLMVNTLGSAKADYGTSYLMRCILILVLAGILPDGGYGNIWDSVLAIIIIQIIASGVNMFKELNTKQFIRNKEHPLKRLFYITFMAPWPRIDSLAVEGVPDSCLIVEPSIFRDSLNFWINNQGVVPDTIKVAIKYHKTDDSLGILVPVVEHLKLSPPKPKLTTNKRTGQVEEVVDTLAKFKLTATPENIDQDGIIFDFDLPMIETPFDSVTVTGINPKQQIEKIKFSVKRDTSNIKRYVLRLEKTLEVGYQYTLKVPHKKFRNIDGNYADSLVQKFSLPTNEDLSSITLEISGTEGEPYIFELVDEKRTKIFRTYSVKEDCELTFPYLKAGNYCLRITRDKNGNGLIDTGSVLEKRQPEQVLLFKFANIPGDEAYLLELRERTDLVQTINIPALFK